MGTKRPLVVTINAFPKNTAESDWNVAYFAERLFVIESEEDWEDVRQYLESAEEAR